MLKGLTWPPVVSGDRTINNGNLVIGTSGKGIDFSADANNPGVTSELFDDYEEGLFTPAFSGDGSNPTVTYSSQYGKYTKLGDMCFVSILLNINTTSGGSGQLRISGMPFVAAANSSGALSRQFVYNFANPLRVFCVPPNLDSVLIFVDDITNTTAQTTDLQNGAFCQISGWYKTA